MTVRWALGLCALALALVATPTIAADQASTGRQIFVRGSAADEIVATFAGSKTPLPANVRRCAACHGPHGAGGREGGADIPPLTWSVLTAPRGATPARPGRPAYDEAALARALSDGIDPAGRSLAAGMPRFRLTPPQLAALVDHLRVVGTERDVEPGITADEIRVGAVLPLSGPHAAWGQAMRDGLALALAAAGPIYGRRVRVVAADAGDDTARLAAEVFALVGTTLPPGGARAEDLEDIPVIGPLVPTPAQAAANQFHLLAPLEDQMRVLVDALARETPHPLRLAVLGPAGAIADAVADQAARNGATVVRHSDAEDAVLPPALEPAPDAIVVLPGVELTRLVARLADRPGNWLLAGRTEALALGELRDERLRLVLPVLPIDPRRDKTSALITLPPLAVAAAAVLVEGLKRMGARATRAGLVAALETLHAFPTDVVPPLSFAPGQRIGTRAAVVIRPDRTSGIVVLGDWRAPR